MEPPTDSVQPTGVAVGQTPNVNNPMPDAMNGRQFLNYNPLGSAHGTDHPADQALGKAQFVGSLASGAGNYADALHATSAIGGTSMSSSGSSGPQMHTPATTGPMSVGSTSTLYKEP